MSITLMLFVLVEGYGFMPGRIIRLRGRKSPLDRRTSLYQEQKQSGYLGLLILKSAPRENSTSH